MSLGLCPSHHKGTGCLSLVMYPPPSLYHEGNCCLSVELCIPLHKGTGCLSLGVLPYIIEERIACH